MRIIMYLFRDYCFMEKRSSLTQVIPLCEKLQFGSYSNYPDTMHFFLGIVTAYWMTLALKSNGGLRTG